MGDSDGNYINFDAIMYQTIIKTRVNFHLLSNRDIVKVRKIILVDQKLRTRVEYVLCT